ncbi:MAG: OmpA family protein [Muribaculaceae bacterium]|nr:OmpA family protein [Muribaculaceae bacterium]MDE5958982.1 OmpA family protein [Muribaculaceae bacterium]MDE5971728.1 OmpA family protein [Muribaculaceae bacterium]MDE6462699.1 OmpA family protein [Muribaculaceae bacterium]
MKTDKDFKRLEGHPEPKELPEHAADVSNEAAASAKQTPEPQPAPPSSSSTADIDEVRGGGGFGWAAIGGLAAALIVGSVAYMAGVFMSPDRPARHTGNDVAQTTRTYAVPDSRQSGSMTVVDNTSEPDAVYFFDLNGSAIAESDVLDAVAKKARETGAEVTVNAYTDNSGRTDYNIRLSEQRAKAVGDYLVAHGVARDHVRTYGRGPTKAYASAAQDRRAEVRLSI